MLGCLVCAFESACPDGEWGVFRQAAFAEKLGEHLGVLKATIGEVGVAADLTREIVLGLTVTREPNASRLDVEVGQEVDESRLKVVLNAIDDDLMAYICGFDVSQLLFGFVNGLVDLLIHLDAIPEIFGCLFWVLSAHGQLTQTP